VILAQRHHDELIVARDEITRQLERFGPATTASSFVHRLVHGHLTALADQLGFALLGECPEQPEELIGHPIGQYHCPYCGCMALAGMAGHWHDEDCWLGLNDPDDPALHGPQPMSANRIEE